MVNFKAHLPIFKHPGLSTLHSRTLGSRTHSTEGTSEGAAILTNQLQPPITEGCGHLHCLSKRVNRRGGGDQKITKTRSK